MDLRSIFRGTGRLRQADKLDQAIAHYEMRKANVKYSDLSEVIEYASTLVQLGFRDEHYEQCLQALIFYDTFAAPRDSIMQTIYALGSMLNDDNGSKFAIQLFEWAAAMDEYYYPAYGRIGDSYRLLGAYEEAICWYKTAVTLGDNSVNRKTIASAFPLHNYKGDYYMKIGYCLWRRGDPENAREFVKHAEKLVDADFRAYLNLGANSWDQVMEMFGTT